jgi:hypothetical protein
MNEETYEALKIVMSLARLNCGENMNKTRDAINQVENWIDETAKDYND